MYAPDLILQLLPESVLRSWLADVLEHRLATLEQLTRLTPTSAGLPFAYQRIQQEVDGLQGLADHLSAYLNRHFPAQSEE